MKTFRDGLTLAEMADFLSRSNVSSQAGRLADGQMFLQAQLGPFVCNVVLYGSEPIATVDVPGELVQLVAMFTAEGKDSAAELAFANDWNRRKIIGKAYADPEGGVGIEQSFIVKGTDEAHLGSNMTMWFSLVQDFAAQLYA